MPRAFGNPLKIPWLRRVLGLGLGALGGYLYYRHLGCVRGCPIWQDPLTSAGLGGLLGLLALW